MDEDDSAHIIKEYELIKQTFEDVKKTIRCKIQNTKYNWKYLEEFYDILDLLICFFNQISQTFRGMPNTIKHKQTILHNLIKINKELFEGNVIKFIKKIINNNNNNNNNNCNNGNARCLTQYCTINNGNYNICKGKYNHNNIQSKRIININPSIYVNNFKNKVLNGYDTTNGRLLMNNHSPIVTINVENTHVYKKPQQINGGKALTPLKQCCSSRNRNISTNNVKNNINKSVDVSKERKYCCVGSYDKGIIKGCNCQTVCNTKTSGDNEDEDFFCDVMVDRMGRKFRNVSC
jgi:hypothetical protein